MVPFCLFSYQFQLCLNLVYVQNILRSVEVAEWPPFERSCSFGKTVHPLFYAYFPFCFSMTGYWF